MKNEILVWKYFTEDNLQSLRECRNVKERRGVFDAVLSYRDKNWRNKG